MTVYYYILGKEFLFQTCQLSADVQYWTNVESLFVCLLEQISWNIYNKSPCNTAFFWKGRGQLDNVYKWRTVMTLTRTVCLKLNTILLWINTLLNIVPIVFSLHGGRVSCLVRYICWYCGQHWVGGGKRREMLSKLLHTINIRGGSGGGPVED